MKKLKIVLSLGIISLIGNIISIILLLAINPFTINGLEINDSESITFSTLGLFLLIIYIFSWIIERTASIMILAFNFENKEVNDSRILWGLLSLFLLGSLGAIIFSTINFKKYKNDPNDSEITNNIE
ncbi:MAG: hypothetical protein ACRCXE_00315 [Metamycoplasmataceae bacterium]